MAIYEYHDIKNVHIEITSKCNALCPMCVRSMWGAKVNPNLELVELSLEDIKKIFTVEFVKQLKRMNFCGNYGDPAMANELLEVLAWLRKCNPEIFFSLSTNGGVRNQDWWKELSKFFNQPGSIVSFGIDGLEDTNHLYRINVKWHKLMNNSASFIKSGGNAVWNFIVFKHNEHQVHQAYDMSKEMGFKLFRKKETERFDLKDVHGKIVYAEPVYDQDFNFSHFIEPPSKRNNPFYYSDAKKTVDLNKYAKELKEKKVSLKIDTAPNLNIHRKVEKNDLPAQKFKQKCSVQCFVKKEKSIFINHLGQVFPCCWVAWPYHAFWNSFEVKEIREMMDKSNGEDSINGKKSDLKQIIQGSFFHAIEKGISSKNPFDALDVCSRTCGHFGVNRTKDRPG